MNYLTDWDQVFYITPGYKIIYKCCPVTVPLPRLTCYDLWRFAHLYESMMDVMCMHIIEEVCDRNHWCIDLLVNPRKSRAHRVVKERQSPAVYHALQLGHAHHLIVERKSGAQRGEIHKMTLWMWSMGSYMQRPTSQNGMSTIKMSISNSPVAGSLKVCIPATVLCFVNHYPCPIARPLQHICIITSN
jgi:hypothetical protein